MANNFYLFIDFDLTLTENTQIDILIKQFPFLSTFFNKHKINEKNYNTMLNNLANKIPKEFFNKENLKDKISLAPGVFNTFNDNLFTNLINYWKKHGVNLKIYIISCGFYNIIKSTLPLSNIKIIANKTKIINNKIKIIKRIGPKEKALFINKFKNKIRNRCIGIGDGLTDINMWKTIKKFNGINIQVHTNKNNFYKKTTVDYILKRNYQKRSYTYKKLNWIIGKLMVNCQ